MQQYNLEEIWNSCDNWEEFEKVLKEIKAEQEGEEDEALDTMLLALKDLKSHEFPNHPESLERIMDNHIKSP